MRLASSSEEDAHGRVRAQCRLAEEGKIGLQIQLTRCKLKSGMMLSTISNQWPALPRSSTTSDVSFATIFCRPLIFSFIDARLGFALGEMVGDWSEVPPTSGREEGSAAGSTRM